MREPEFTYDPEIVLTAFLESRISSTGRIPSLEETLDKRIDWLKDIQTMSRWYDFMKDYHLRPDLMK